MHGHKQEMGSDAAAQATADDRAGAFLVKSWFLAAAASLLITWLHIGLSNFAPVTRFWDRVLDVIWIFIILINAYVALVVLYVVGLLIVELARRVVGRGV